MLARCVATHDHHQAAHVIVYGTQTTQAHNLRKSWMNENVLSVVGRFHFQIGNRFWNFFFLLSQLFVRGGRGRRAALEHMMKRCFIILKKELHLHNSRPILHSKRKMKNLFPFSPVLPDLRLANQMMMLLILLYDFYGSSNSTLEEGGWALGGWKTKRGSEWDSLSFSYYNCSFFSEWNVWDLKIIEAWRWKTWMLPLCCFSLKLFWENFCACFLLLEYDVDYRDAKCVKWKFILLSKNLNAIQSCCRKNLNSYPLKS